MMRYPILGFTFLLESVVHYFLCLRSFKASFSFLPVLVGGMGMACRGFLSPSAPDLLDGGWRASSALVVTSMASFIPSVVRIHWWDLLSHQNMQTTKVQTFTSLPSPCLSTIPIPLQVPTKPTTSHHSHVQYTSSTLPSHSFPSPANITRRHHHLINTSSSPSNVY